MISINIYRKKLILLLPVLFLLLAAAVYGSLYEHNAAKKYDLFDSNLHTNNWEALSSAISGLIEEDIADIYVNKLELDWSGSELASANLEIYCENKNKGYIFAFSNGRQSNTLVKEREGGKGNIELLCKLNDLFSILDKYSMSIFRIKNSNNSLNHMHLHITKGAITQREYENDNEKLYLLDEQQIVQLAPGDKVKFDNQTTALIVNNKDCKQIEYYLLSGFSN